MVDVKQLKKAKKKWISIVGPRFFNNKELGESYCYDTKPLVGKLIRVSLMILTDDPKRQSVNVVFKISNVKEDKAYTDIVGYEILPVHVRRMAKRAKQKIEDSFLCQSKDGVKLRIKPMILTKSKVFNSVATNIRKHVNSYITEYFKKNNCDNFLEGVINNDVQRGMKDSIKKLYPVSGCMIRMFEIINK